MEIIADLHDELILYITPEKFFVEAINSNELLVIDRVSQEVTLQGNHGQIPQTSSSKPICGIIGTIRLIAGPYLVVITRKSKIGTINNQDVWLLEDYEIISFTRTLLHLTEKQITENRQYLSMIENVLSTPWFYFSYSYDLTHTLQRLHNTTPEFLQMPLHERADPRFVWNAHLLRDLASQPELHRFCLPLVHGFISVNQCTLNGENFIWSVISRRCCFRAGPRLFTRGVDVQGSVANFVETEQIVEYNGDRSSFVQTRGSIPLFWSQLPNLKYKPRPKLVGTENHAEAFSRHLDTQVFNYGRLVLVNLIDHRGAEDILEKAFREMVTRLGNTNISFKFFLQARSDSLASVYSGAGEGRYGTVTVRGDVEFGLQYNYKAGALEILVKQCRDLAPVDTKRNRSDPYVKVYLLPDKSKSGKRKTKVKKHTLNPVFDETLKFNITLNGLETRTLWLTVWHSDMFGRNDFLGEVTMPLENKVFNVPTPQWYPLQERTEPFDDLLSYKGDIIIGLKFVPPDVTVQKKGKRSRGSLNVLVKEAKNLTAVKANGTSDPFCKSYLLPDKGRSSKQKTPVLRRTCNPVWNYTFVYEDVSLQELSERSLELTVWDHDRLASNEFLGGLRFNLGSGKHYGKVVDWMDATGKEMTLWQKMLERPNFWVEGCLTLRSSLEHRGSS